MAAGRDPLAAQSLAAALRDALLAVDLPVEVQSEADLRAENPAYAWFTALLAIMVDPNANYEIVGVLREVFGLSDDELARFAEGFGARFQLAERTRERGPVADVLNSLCRLRTTILQQPLFSAVRKSRGDAVAGTAAHTPAGYISGARHRAGQIAQRGRNLGSAR